MSVTSDLLPLKPRCRLIAVPTTGLDHIDLHACAERGIEIISLYGEREFLSTVRATSELTIALALSLIRNLPRAVQSVQMGEWDRDQFRGTELYGKTAGIVGLGRLGSITADYFYAFGMRVLGYDVRDDVASSPAVKVDTIEELLEQSDLVSIHVTYTAKTRHLFSAAAFARMKSGAILINTSRGGVVCETALIEALESGRIAGAALDVLDGEPAIDANHPMLRYAETHPNVLITPHIGGNTIESFAKTEVFIADRVLSSLGLENTFGRHQ
jgi:D-3-phosphoglycerate dehydrogenase